MAQFFRKKNHVFALRFIMALKRKIKKHKKSGTIIEHNWKPIAIECSEGFNQDDFAGLVGLEELEGGSFVDSSSRNNQLRETIIDSNNIENRKNKKKIKKQKTNSNFNVIRDPSLVNEDDDELEFEEFHGDDDNQNLDMSEWESLSVPEPIVNCLRNLRMPNPTPIQKATISTAIESGRNVYGAAPTGSGKTLAFSIPMVAGLLKDSDDNKHVKALVLTPTRELAVQIKKHMENIIPKEAGKSKLKVALVVGGLAVQKQERILSKNIPDIVVATTGRLWELINGGNIKSLNRETMNAIKYLIIDEADRMIEKSHFDELKLLLNLLQFTNSQIDRQIFIFSATLTMNKKKKLNKKKKNNESNDPNLLQLLQLDQSTMLVVDLTEGGSKSTPSSDQLEEKIVNCMKEEKDLYLYYFIMENPGRTIIFCNSIDCIRRLVNIFKFLQLSPLAIHSSMQQKRRLAAIERFTTNPNSILIATDVASRGLDIPSVNHVVHYQCPRSAEIYIHRAGRTARVDQHGLSLILCDPQEEAFFLKDFFRILHKQISDLSSYETRSIILRKLKERIRLAQLCDETEHRLRKERTNESWFIDAARSADIILSEDESDIEDLDDESSETKRNKAKNNRKLKNLRGQLNSLLKQKISFQLK